MQSSTLIKAIDSFEKLKGINDQGFTKIIGADETSISQVRSGRVRAGRKILGGILRNVPELTMAVIEDLKEEK